MPAVSSFAEWPVSLTTERLTLRPLTPADVPVHIRLWTDPRVRRHLGGPVPQDVARARGQRCVGVPGLLSVVRAEGGVVVGSVLVEPGARDGRTEVSYQLLPEHWGRGYGREAVRAVVAWWPQEVVAVTQEANAPSRRLLEELGVVPAERFVEWGEPQVLYRLAGNPPTGPGG
ncbi:GNAT family N-acetyltransferase [Streptomyces sp. NPDC052682]|uniref:GNAT family N-acetyltransferase n=1 Tax=Streptomyces sp. NPDC052682 TaxID=3154954 RepID=UPI00342E8939